MLRGINIYFGHISVIYLFVFYHFYHEAFSQVQFKVKMKAFTNVTLYGSMVMALVLLSLNGDLH